MFKIIFLYWWQEKRNDRKENYGDLLSKYLVKKISKNIVVSVSHPLKGLHKYFFKNYLVIGSIITAASKQSMVWGSGIIKKDENVRGATFLAVRGPKTRQRLLDLGYECPEIYGDPAILLPLYYPVAPKKRYKIGIIPHYVDYQFVKSNVADSAIKVIDLMTTDVEQTTREILECEYIISSSLHGLIVPQAYNVPALWVKFSEKLSGDNIKFYDYFASMGIDFTNEITLDADSIKLDTLEGLLKDYATALLPESSVLKQRQTELMASCPFKK